VFCFGVAAFSCFGTVFSSYIIVSNQIKGKQMKKVVLCAALVLALGVQALAKHHVAEIQYTAAQEKVYKKIETTAVPASILKEISEKYPGYVVNESYAAEDASGYKIVVKKESDIENIYYNAAGEFVKEEKKA
jgi:hypothetical protein